MKQVEVKILQQSYLLGCKEGQEDRLSEAVAKVDEAMTRIYDAGKVRARERIAVLAALNVAFELGDALRDQKDSIAKVAAAEASVQAHAADGALADSLNQEVLALVERIDAALSSDDKHAEQEHVSESESEQVDVQPNQVDASEPVQTQEEN